MTHAPAQPRHASDRRSTLKHLAGVAIVALAQRGFASPAWPSGTIRLVVVYASGGLSDDTARFIAQKLTVRLGVPVRVENRPGGGGSVGMDLLAKSRSDGSTFAFSAISPLTLSPHLTRLPYDALTDIVPVASVMHTPVLIIGTPAFAGRTFQDMLAVPQADSGRVRGGVRWATSGSGTTGHMVLEQIRSASAAAITHIPYKGGGQPLTEALGGHFDVLSTHVTLSVLQHIRSGKFKPLAVGSPQRLAVLPDTPTLKELGFAGANLTSNFGVFAPAKTPPDIVHRLNLELNAIVEQPEFVARLTSANQLPGGGSAAEFAQEIAMESRRNAELIARGHIRPE